MDQNLVYRVYYPAFYARRSVGAIYRECRQANKRCELPPQPKKPHESRASRGKGRGLSPLGGTTPPSTGSKMGRKKGRRGVGGGTGTGGMVPVL